MWFFIFQRTRSQLRYSINNKHFYWINYLNNTYHFSYKVEMNYRLDKRHETRFPPEPLGIIARSILSA